MGDFRRQPSKVWWMTYEEEDLSRLSGFLNWGKSVDLSGTFDSINNNLTSAKPAIVFDDEDKGTELTPEGSGRREEQQPTTAEKTRESDRGSSSSPSQGSHKSQDSGFSDSEVQHNALSLSPRSSPELSERSDCVECKAREESKAEVDEKTYNETVVSYRRLKTSVKSESPDDGKLTKSVKFLETAFDGGTRDDISNVGAGSTVGTVGAPQHRQSVLGIAVGTPKHKKKNLLKSHFSRTKLDTLEKINQIQNQLELSFKLPKKINLPQNLKLGNIFHGRCHGDSLDSEGFKVPKVPGEQSMVCRGSGNVMDLTDIGGPPIGSSTPKSFRFSGNFGRESPVPRAARATEKKLETKSTFATIRRLKALPEKRTKTASAAKSGSVSCSSGNASEKFSPDAESSVKQWLSELETMYEAEIMTTLQSKSLATDLTRQVTNMADSTSHIVRRLHHKTKIISSEFSKLCQDNKNKNDKQIRSSVQNLVEHITEFVREYVQKKELIPRTERLTHQREVNTNQRQQMEAENCHEMITDFRQPEPETVEVKKKESVQEEKTEETEVLSACEALSSLVQKEEMDREKVEAEVTKLGQKFTKVVDMLLESHIQALVRVIEEPRTELTLRTALAALTSLGLEGNHLGQLVSKCGGIRILLAVCLEARATAVRVWALRALATVCCVSDTIRQFEQAGGVEILSDILSDKNRCESELSEAAAVIAQITAPWVQDNHSVDGLSQFLNSLVTSLTRIVSKYKSSETLLLASAALANLTFMEPRTVWPLLENETAKKLLTAVRRQGPKVSVFIQEQAATVIANMAAVPECRKHLTEQKAVVALLCFLEIHHSPLQRAPEVAAAERVQQKSAIAISRLCSDAVVAKQVIELQGVHWLVRLCKEEKERNHSDGVLVACLAALRKIVANCGTEALVELNAMELVEPRLLDSFLLYSSKQESYV